MEFKGMNLCDFCFEPISPGAPCPKCGLTHENYNAEAGLLMPGTNLLGKYIVGRVLGRGGFGATYLAYSSELDRVVAVKEYYPTGIANRAKGEEQISAVSEEKRRVFEKGANRLFEEAKTMAKFNSNRNVVSVYEFFHANGTVYYSMEYLEGMDLKSYIGRKGGSLSEGEAFSVMKGVCEALFAVHSTQTLHRDISPDNIFVCTDGTVKLIDFGAAKQVIGDAQQVYSVVVKQGFAPAEQYSSNGKQGVWTDIYAVGATIYYAVTGKIPADAMNRVENPEIVFDDALNLSEAFKEIIKKCLQRKIEDRFQSAMELLDALNMMNGQGAVLGGTDYVQTIYNGVKPALDGGMVDFSNINSAKGATEMRSANGYNYNNQNALMDYQQQSYDPHFVRSYSYYEEERSGLNGLIVGGAVAVIILLLVMLIISIFRPAGFGPQFPGFGPPPPPPQGGMMPPPMGFGNMIIPIVLGVILVAVVVALIVYISKKKR